MDVYRSGIVIPNPEVDKHPGYQYRNGLIVPESILPDWSKIPIGIDLFCGVGGFSLGMMQAGINIVAGCDWNTDCAITYTHNLGAYPMRFEFITPEDEERMEKALRKEFGYNDRKKSIRKVFTTGGGWVHGQSQVPGVGTFFLGDLRKLTGEHILKVCGLKRGEVDIVCGGPPCQGFSRAGKQNVMDPRNSLVFDFARLVLEIFPRSMVMENVPEVATMITPDGVPVIDVLCHILESGSFGSFDILKKSLVHNPTAGGLMRSTNDKHKRKKKSHNSQLEFQESLL